MSRAIIIQSAVTGDDGSTLVFDYDDDGNGNNILVLKPTDGSARQIFRVEPRGHIWNPSVHPEGHLTRDPLAPDPGKVYFRKLDEKNPNQVWNYNPGNPWHDNKRSTLIVSSDDAQTQVLQVNGPDQAITIEQRDPKQTPQNQSWYDIPVDEH